MKKPKIYLGHPWGHSESLSVALKTMTDEWIDEGNHCNQTIIDLRDACKYLLSENKKLKKDETV